MEGQGRGGGREEALAGEGREAEEGSKERRRGDGRKEGRNGGREAATKTTLLYPQFKSDHTILRTGESPLN